MLNYLQRRPWRCCPREWALFMSFVLCKKGSTSLALRSIGIPCMGDRFPDALLSLSRAAAVVKADGLSSMAARRAGPFRFTSSIRAKYVYINAEC